MKKTLTKEQKINEFIGKALKVFLNRTASKTLDKLIKNDPKLGNLVKVMNGDAEALKKYVDRNYNADF